MGGKIRVVILDRDHERRALADAATFLHRSGTALATRLLTVQPSEVSAPLLAEFRDQLLSASLLCRDLVDLGDLDA